MEFITLLIITGVIISILVALVTFIYQSIAGTKSWMLYLFNVIFVTSLVIGTLYIYNHFGLYSGGVIGMLDTVKQTVENVVEQ